MIHGRCVSSVIVHRWMSRGLTDNKSTLVRVMAWCRQATSHYLGQWWPRYHMASLRHNDLTRDALTQNISRGIDFLNQVTETIDGCVLIEKARHEVCVFSQSHRRTQTITQNAFEDLNSKKSLLSVNIYACASCSKRRWTDPIMTSHMKHHFVTSSMMCPKSDQRWNLI